MGCYDKYILPRLLHFACGLEEIAVQRRKVVPLAKGAVLEIGIGSGLNLPFYNPAAVKTILGLDPSPEMRSLGREMPSGGVAVRFIEGSGEAIPLPDASVDTVLVTYSLCTIQGISRTLEDIRRVLKPNGVFLFCEHGASIDAGIRKWQDRVDPIWTRFAGGCHLNRDIPSLIEGAGFRIKVLDHGYIPGWRPACFNYWGHAVHE
ncbi:MAG: class I SAM-dependent methyltransferase [Nitrospiria bacterium]